MTAAVEAPEVQASPAPGAARARNRIGLLSTPALIFLAACYLIPLLYIVRTSFTDPTLGWHNYADALIPIYRRVLVRTLLASVIGCAVTAVIGYPVAYMINRSGRIMQRLLVLGVISPYLTSVLVRTFAWQVILGRLGPIPRFLRLIGLHNEGLLQTWLGLALGIIQVSLPLFVLPLVAVMRQVDTNAVRAARSLGAGPAVAFWRVFVPQTLPGVEVGVILTFVSFAGAYVLPVVLGGGSTAMLGVIINNEINQQGDVGASSAMAVILTLAIFIIIALFHLAMLPSRRWLALRGGHNARTSRMTRRRHLSVTPVLRALDASGISRWRWPLPLIVGIIEIYLFVPQLLAIPISFSGTQSLVFPPHGWSLTWYREFGTSQWLTPLATSFIVAPVGAVIATLLGALAAMGLERSQGRYLRRWAPTVLLAPMVVPIVVVSVGFYLLLQRLNLTDTKTGLVLAETTIVIPLAFIICRASVQALDPVYERAARSLGSGRTRVLRRIVFPLIRPALLVTLLFTFLTVFDEVVIPIFVTAVNVVPLPKQLYNSVVFASDPTIAVVGVFSLVLGAVVLGLSILFGGARAAGGGAGALAALTNTPGEDSDQTST